MGFTLYKPNKGNKGSLLDFSFTSKGDKKGIFANFVAQNGWDQQARGGEGNGIFKDGKKLGVKLSVYEVGEIINAIERREDGPAKGFYHKSESGSTQIYFKRYKGKVKDGDKWVEGPDYTGYSFSAVKGEDRFNVPITFGEVRALKEYLCFCLEKIFGGILSDEIQRAKEYAAKAKPQTGEGSPPKSVESFVSSEEEEPPF